MERLPKVTAAAENSTSRGRGTHPETSLLLEIKSHVFATPALPCLPIFLPPYSSGSSTHLAYGAGAQLRLTSVAVRVEYERISAGSGDVDLVSLGLTFAF
jgi:opacity protein-like surface antigen